MTRGRTSLLLALSTVFGLVLVFGGKATGAGQNDILCESSEHGQRLCFLGPQYEGLPPGPPYFRVIGLRGTAHISWKTKATAPPPRNEQSTIKGHSADWRISFGTPRGYRSIAFQIPYVKGLPRPPLTTTAALSESWWNFETRRTCADRITKVRRDSIGFYTGRTKATVIVAYRIPEPDPCAQKQEGEGVYIGPEPDWDGDLDTEPDVGGLGYVFAVRELRKSELRKRVISVPLVVNRTFDTHREGKPWLESTGRVRWSATLAIRRVSAWRS